MTEELVCGDYGQSKLSSESFSKLRDFMNQLENDHEIKNGGTALWVHLVAIVSNSIEEKK